MGDVENMAGLDLDGEKKNDKIFLIAKDLIFETNIIKRLQGMDVLIGMLDDSLKKTCDYDKYVSDTSTYIKNPEFLREARLVSTITDNIETAMEYYGKDYLNGSDFIFRQDFEEKKDFVNKVINSFLGRLLLEVTATEDINF